MARPKKKRSRRRREVTAEARRADLSAAGSAPPPAAALTAAPLDGNDLRAAVIAGALALVLYVSTGCRTIFGGDSAELAAAAATLGVPHPPGYPTYTMVTAAVVHALFFLEPAHAANLASGLYGAGAVALAYLVCRRFALRARAAAFAAVTLAVGATFWSQSLVAEVYTFDLLLLMAVVLLVVVPDVGRRRLVVAAVVLGLWLGHRMVNVIYLPAIALLAASGELMRRLRAAPRDAALFAGVAAAALVVPYGYLPLASLRDPAIDVGDPTSWDRFWTVVSASPYTRHLDEGFGIDTARFGDLLAALPREGGLACAAALAACVFVARKPGARRRQVIGFALAAVAGIVFASRYRILDVSAYLLPAIAAVVLLGAIGLGLALERFAPSMGAGAAHALAVALGLVVVPWSARGNDLSQHRASLVWAESLVASAALPGVLVVEGDTTIHGLWYLAATRGGSARELVVLSPGHLHPWYYDELRARHPNAPWPAELPSGSQQEKARGIIDALAPTHSIHLTYSVDTGPYVAPPAADPNASRGLVPRGVVQEALPRGATLSVSERVALNDRLLGEAFSRLAHEPNAEVDSDTKSTLVGLALAAVRAGELAERGGHRAEAKRAYRLALGLDPDRHQRDIESEVLRGLGFEIPKLRPGEAAKQGVERVSRDSVGGG